MVKLISELMDEHRNIEEYTARLLNIFVREHGRGVDSVDDLRRNLEGLMDLLKVHMDFEEREIYPLLGEGDSIPLLREHIRIMGIFRDTIKRIESINVARRIRLISRMIREHIDREEEALRHYISIHEHNK